MMRRSISVLALFQDEISVVIPPGPGLDLTSLHGQVACVLNDVICRSSGVLHILHLAPWRSVVTRATLHHHLAVIPTCRISVVQLSPLGLNHILGEGFHIDRLRPLTLNLEWMRDVSLGAVVDVLSERLTVGGLFH